MIERLRAIAGDAAVRAPIPGDEVHGVAPRVVLAPSDAQTCAAVLAACSEHGWRVEVGGARSSGDWGRPVDAVDVLLLTTRMSGVRDYEPDDLTVGVQAGTTLAELRARVQRNRQRVPLDAPAPRATVGGVLARAAAGPQRLSWSTPRRQTLGIELVTGDGRVLRVGGRVVKNVAGYDLNKLIVGSFGTLGVITSAHLRLLPVPAETATHALVAESPETLASAARELLGASVQPALLELTGPPWRLVVRYEGAAEALAAAAEHVARVATDAGAAHMRDDEAIPGLAALEEAAALVVRLGDLPDRLAHTLAAARQLAGTGATLAAHAGDGIVRVIGDAEHARALAPAAFAAALEETRGRVDGSVVVERAPAAIMHVVEPWGPLSETVMRITRDLKRQFDPAGILNRGRWIA